MTEIEIPTELYERLQVEAATKDLSVDQFVDYLCQEAGITGM